VLSFVYLGSLSDFHDFVSVRARIFSTLRFAGVVLVEGYMPSAEKDFFSYQGFPLYDFRFVFRSQVLHDRPGIEHKFYRCRWIGVLGDNSSQADQPARDSS
jgi:hypothetical protein